MFFRRVQETPVTLALFFIHFILYGLMSWQDSHGATILQSTLSLDVLRGFGAQHNPLIWEGQLYRLLTAAFLHGGIWHLFFNNLALYNLGVILERLLGSAGFVVLYFFSLLAGNVATLVFVNPLSFSVGASGAIMGMAGALALFLLLDNQGRFLRTTAGNKRFFFFLVALNLVIGELFPVINNQAHLGGFAAGICFAFFFWSRLPFYKRFRTLGGLAFLGAGFVLAAGTYQGLRPQKSHAWHFYHGVRAFEKGDAKEARQQLHQVLQQKRDLPTLKILGKIYEQTKAWGEMAAIYHEIRQLQPKDPMTSVHLVEALTNIGQGAQADREIQRIQKVLQDKPYQRMITAMLLSVRQKGRKALLLYQELLAQHPRQSTLHNAYAWFLLTAEQKKYRQPKLALQHAKLAKLHNQSCSAAILDTLATAYAAVNRPSMALQSIKQAYACPDAKEMTIHLKRQQKKFSSQLSESPSTQPRPTTRAISTPSPTLKKTPTTK